MKSLLTTIAKGLVEFPDEVDVSVDDVNDDGVVIYHLRVAQSDMGRVIGKQGRIAKAIRMIMRSAAVKNNLHIKAAVVIETR